MTAPQAFLRRSRALLALALLICLVFIQPSIRGAGVSGPTITSPAFPNAVINQAYTQTVTVTGGTGPYTFSIVSGTLPAGLTLSPAGVLSGTTSTAGSFTFTMSVRDASGQTTPQAYTIAVLPVATAPSISVTSDGRLGPASGYFIYDWVQYYINTDNGVLYSQYSNYPWDVIQSPAARVISQPNGPDIRVFDFTSFTISPNIKVSIVGSKPAIIATTDGVSIGGSLNVYANGGVGGTRPEGNFDAGASGSASPGSVIPTGGGGGSGAGAVVSSYRTPWGWEVYTGAGGGGGGSASQGGTGWAGSLAVDLNGVAHQFLGAFGGLAQGANVLQGGGGGGQGGYAHTWYCCWTGGPGAAGGGALMFESGGGFQVSSTGAIHADGGNGPYYQGDAGGGGGGGGGYLVFDVAGDFRNDGAISARGGAPSTYTDRSHGGAGSGGRVVINRATTITNTSMIDVSAGDGNASLGGVFSGAAVTVTGSGSITGIGSTPVVSGVTTSSGSNITTSPSSNATVTFAEVAAGGTTTIVNIDPASAGLMPNGYAATTMAYDVTTTAAYGSSITVCFAAPGFTSEVFAHLRVLHGESGVLVDRTILAPDTPAPNFRTNTVCARVSSLSPFVLAFAPSAPAAFTQSISTPAGACICSPVLMNAEGSNNPQTSRQNWFIKADATGVLNLNVFAHAVNLTEESGSMSFTLFDPSDQQLSSVTVPMPTGTNPSINPENSATLTSPSTADAVYRLQVDLGAPTVTARQGHHYRFELHGAAEAEELSPGIKVNEGVNPNKPVQWGLNVSAGESLSVDVLTGLVNAGGSDAFTQTAQVQVIDPSGAVRFADAGLVSLPRTVTIPAAGDMPGQWRLEIVNAPQHYQLNKTSGADRGIYMSWLTFGTGHVSVSVTRNGVPTNTQNLALLFTNTSTGQAFSTVASSGYATDLPVGSYTVTPQTAGASPAGINIDLTCGSSVALSFDVPNHPPTVMITGGPFNVQSGGAPINLNATAFDADGDPLTFQWSLVSGGGLLTPFGSSASYSNNTGAATAVVQVTVTDSFGATASATATIMVTAPTHLWHADYTMDWAGVRTSGDQLLNGSYQFVYNWRFGMLNDPNGPLNAPTISVATGLPSLIAGQQPGVTLNAGNPPYTWTGSALAPAGQPNSALFTSLNSAIRVPSLSPLGYDVSRQIVEGRTVPGNAMSLVRTFIMTFVTRDATLTSLGGTVNFAGTFGPQQGPVTASNVACSGPGNVNIFAGQPVFWQVGQPTGSGPLPVGTTYTLNCSFTVSNSSAFPVTFSPSVVASGQRTAAPIFTDNAATYTTPGASADPSDPLGVVSFTSTTNPTRAELDVHFARTANLVGANTILDTVAPVTAWSLPPSSSGWYNMPSVGVNLTATDPAPSSGVKQITYSLSGAQTLPATTFFGPNAFVNISAAGTTTVTVFATDNAGNVETPKTFTVSIDHSAPTTTAALSPAVNSLGWNNTPIVVTLTATDTGGSDVQQIIYSLGAGPQIVVPGSSATFTVTTAGVTNINYFARDNAGNIEFTKFVSVQIDQTAPSTSPAFASPGPKNLAGQNWWISDVTVNLNGFDSCGPGVPCSGIAKTWYSATGAQPIAFTSVAGQNASVIISTEGQTTITYYVEDRAGNVSPTATFVVNLDKTPPTVSVSSAPTVNEGSLLTIAANVSGGGDPSTWSWTVLSGGGALTPSTDGLSAVYQRGNAPATVSVKLTVPDGHGNTSSATTTFDVINLPPSVTMPGRVTITEGQSISVQGQLSDPGGRDTFGAATVDYGDGTGAQALTFTQPTPPPGYVPGSFTLNHIYATAGTYTVTVTVTDSGGFTGAGRMTVTVTDGTPPVITLAASFSVSEGGSVTIPVQVTDNSGTVASVTWTTSLGTVTGGSTGATFTGADGPATATVTVTATDPSGNKATATTTVTVVNVPPTISAVSGPTAPSAINTAITVSATFTDPGTADTHTCVVAWGDGTTLTVTAAGSGNGSCSATHAYAAAGLYAVSVSVTDKDGGTATAQLTNRIVIFDPNAGFVTGGGYVDLPTGRANFGFNAKYIKNQVNLTGETEFQMNLANVNFHSTGYAWLVVYGVNSETAVWTGTGTVNGSGTYSFQFTVVDGQRDGTGVDKMQMKIWNADGTVYDTGALVPITNGSIVIHVG